MDYVHVCGGGHRCRCEDYVCMEGFVCVNPLYVCIRSYACMWRLCVCAQTCQLLQLGSCRWPFPFSACSWKLTLSFLSASLSLPQDDLAKVEELVVQVKEKTSKIQALSHATVRQYLPVRGKENLSCCGLQKIAPQGMPMPL